ncbi:hypothetical protein L596_001163 [Steinernema carpocapsae]|uniref:Chromo shadow domain-containing protein n=1 Tax=Steinernema carpocapsae TaxID=34508 RepID=A0A4U8ULH5_STECR|nr:hypothetical protein L596_001163 [Steinernema carpocapsae]
MEVEQPVLAPAPAIDYSLDSSYRVVNGAKVKKITGVSNVRPEEVMVIVEYDDKGIEAVPSRILRNYFSSKLIDFYESKLDFRHL